jgi:hypothetical protein
MNIEDIKKAKEEAEKFIALVDDFFIADDSRESWHLTCPAEIGLVKAQSLILSRQLSAMRNPWTCKRGKRK